MSRKRKNTWLTSEEIHEQWLIWKNSNNEFNKRIIPDEMAKQMMLVCEHLLQHPRFSRYPQALKDDMRQEGILKIIKNLKNMKEEYSKSFFNYFTTCAWTAFVTVLASHYKDLNMKRKLIVEALSDAQEEFGHNKANQEVINHLTKELELYDKQNGEDEGE